MARFLQASAKRSLFSFRCRRNGSVAATFPVRRHLEWDQEILIHE